MTPVNYIDAVVYVCFVIWNHFSLGIELKSWKFVDKTHLGNTYCPEGERAIHKTVDSPDKCLFLCAQEPEGVCNVASFVSSTSECFGCETVETQGDSFIRYRPTSYDFLVTGPKGVADNQLTSSSVYAGLINHDANRARLNLTRTSDGNGGWTPYSSTLDPWDEEPFIMNFNEDSEAGINKQINMELYASYVYMSVSYFFDRDDIALNGFAKFFKESSEAHFINFLRSSLRSFMKRAPDEEREHAEKLMKYQNKRGGRAVLRNISKPDRDEWGSGLDAMKTALYKEDCHLRWNSNHEVTFDGPKYILGIVTQGRGSSDFTQYVKSYRISMSQTGNDFAMVKDSGSDKIFEGNTDNFSSVTNMLDEPMFATCLRIHPFSHFGLICLRFDVLGI